jgi:hypothetical protein
MMLIGNGSTLGRNPNKRLGAASSLVANRANWAQPGAQHGFAAGEATVISGSSIADTAARPNGYEPPGSWLLPIKGGGLSCYNNIQGEGELTITSLAMGTAIAASLSGSGTISAAALSLITSLAATLAGDGNLSPAPNLQTVSSLAADLDGAGDVDAALSIIMQLIAALSGSGTASGNLRGTSSLSADIVVSGELLTTANVAQAVWEAVSRAEPDFTYERFLRIIAAAVAGKTSGGPTNFDARDLSDTEDMINGSR